MGREWIAGLIVDTSALMAIVLSERHWDALLEGLAESHVAIPASVLTEMACATASRGAMTVAAGTMLVNELLRKGAEVPSFEKRHANITALARARYGKGNGRGGRLNFGDLMVYAVAKDRGEPLLCTGADFATTDLALHPASRLET